MGNSVGMSTLRERIPLRRRKIIKKSLSKMIAMSVIALVASGIYLGLIALLTGDPTSFIGGWITDHETLLRTMWFCIIGVLIGTSPFYQYLYFLNYFYDVDEDTLIVRKGVIAKREVTLPFKKITDVYVDQDVFDFVLGLYDIHFSTPTAESGKFAHIDGIDKKGSVQLKKLVLDKVNKIEK